MPKVRGVIVTLAPMLTAIVTETLSRELELELLAELQDRANLEKRLRKLRPDLVVIGLAVGESDALGAQLLAKHPALRFLLIDAAGTYAYLHEMRPWRSVLHDFSPDGLLAAIRGG